MTIRNPRRSTGLYRAPVLGSPAAGCERQAPAFYPSGTFPAPPMEERADVAIVGGGVIGTSVAFHLAELGVTDVVLLERSHVASGSTGRSVGIVETSFATDVNVALATRGFEELSRFREVTGETADFHPRRYLETVGDPANVPHLEAVAATGRRHGLHMRVVDRAGVEDVFPELRVDDVAAGLVVEAAGFCDPHSVATGYAAAAKRRGVRVRTNSPAERILLDGGRVTGVRTPHGTVRAPVVVNAAGPWCNELNRTAGLELPLALWQRHVFVTTPHPEIPADRPIYVDLDGRFYFRQEVDGGFVLGLVEDRTPGTNLAEPEVDWDFKVEAVRAAVHRVPRLAETGIASGWSGIVTFTPDQLPILGPVREAEGLYLANGMSGYGVMISPGVGLALAELIALGESRTIDIAPLRYDRFLDAPPVPGAGLWLSRR